MTINDLNKARDKMKTYGTPKNYYFINPICFWQWERKNIKMFNVTDKEIENARCNGYITTRIGVDCYLPIKIMETHETRP